MIEVKEPTKEEIDLITFDDEIYSRSMDDTTLTKEQIKKIFPYGMFKFLGCYLNDDIIGLSSIEGNKFHFEVLKPYRKHARECLKLCLNRIDEPLICEIPTLYRSVINFAKKAGFIELEESINVYRKNNINYKMIKLKYE